MDLDWQCWTLPPFWPSVSVFRNSQPGPLPVCFQMCAAERAGLQHAVLGFGTPAALMLVFCWIQGTDGLSGDRKGVGRDGGGCCQGIGLRLFCSAHSSVGGGGMLCASLQQKWTLPFLPALSFFTRNWPILLKQKQVVEILTEIEAKTLNEVFFF